MAEPARWIDEHEEEEDLFLEDLLPEREDGRPWPAQGEWTYEDYFELLELTEDGRRYELLDGDLLVSPSPRFGHQLSVGRLFRFIDEHVSGGGLGLVFPSPVTIRLPGGRKTRALQPDVVFFRTGNEPRADDTDFVGVPDLVIEALSPGRRNRRREEVRLDVYREAGVPEVWWVDQRARTVTVYVPGEEGRYVPSGCFGVGEEVRSVILPELRLAVAALFMSGTFEV
jgi:Uma2 family endonuclease